MKCLQVASYLGLGGGQNVMMALIEALADDVSFTVFCAQVHRDDGVGRAMLNRLDELDVPVASGTKLPMPYGGMAIGAVGLARLLRRSDFDLVHVHTEYAEAVFAAALALQPQYRRIPLIRTIHNTVLWPGWGRVGQWVERRLSHGSAAAVSTGALKALNRFRHAYGLNALPSNQMRIIRNGVAMPNTLSPRDPCSGAARLLFAGRLESQKGADLLPEILARASAKFRGSVHVDVLGNGTYAPELSHAIDALPVDWTGEIHPPDPNLAAKLSSYDAVLMPSRFEGLPLLCVEALGAGTPVLLTEIEGFSDIVDSAYPLRAPPSDANKFADLLVAFLGDREKYQRSVADIWPGITRRFNMDRMACEYLQMYRTVKDGDEIRQ